MFDLRHGPCSRHTGEVGDGNFPSIASRVPKTVSGSFSRTAGNGTETAITLLNIGWNFIDETDNRTEDIWWIDDKGQHYPRLWWEQQSGN